MTCKHCGEPIHYDDLADCWLHASSNRACDHGRASTHAEPEQGDES